MEVDQEVHDRAQREIQSVINKVAAAELNHPMLEIEATLERELRAAGHWPQPKPWLRAVALELADGRVYVVTKHAWADPHGH